METIYLYQPIYSGSAEDFGRELSAAKGDINVRINCPGGSVYDAVSMIALYRDSPNKKYIKVDGMAKSGAAFLCAATPADQVECLDVSEFMFHRAAYPSWIESDANYFTDAMKQSLAVTNSNLRSLMECKCSSQQFEAVTGTSYDTMFSLDSRVDVNLTAQQMKQLGLVGKVTKLTQSIQREIIALSAQCGIAAFSDKVTKINFKMNVQEIREQHPEAYQAIIALGKKAESERVNAIMGWNNVDATKVAEMIASGEEITPKAIQEFSTNAANKAALAAVAASAAPAVTTGTVTPQVDAKYQAEITALKEVGMTDKQIERIISSKN